ncbi:hypothetical protein GGI25_003704 [Coemansia spiralis]|uniref:Major facilitator superfamily (MFS) profile domain-containing protein n=2 Tax=Coemansia TaxID=4863 RepID=A0A9W8G844_9FUNG|nr:hypothetical protein EDC05_003116 [Coemansia umbellata]KAJ2676198.1 hypothetical protein GGI25_003704 [Coemansia spiralis]
MQESMLFSRISLQGVRSSPRRGLVCAILEYFSHTEYHPTLEQIEKDRYVFFGLIRCRQWMAIPAGVLIQFCYGSVYAWSIFNAPINELVNTDSSKQSAEITFYIALGVLGFTGAIFGPWIETHHPRKSGIIGLLVFYAGHLTSALALQMRMISLLYFGYGFVAGIGLGIGYVSTIDAVSKWWPKARGTAAGCAVMGFGGGSLAFSAINRWLVVSTSLPLSFLILGSLNFTVMIISIQFLCPPPPGHNINGIPIIETVEKQQLGAVECKDYECSAGSTHLELTQQPCYTDMLSVEKPVLHISLAEALRSRDFWLLYVSFLANIVFCLVILSNLPSMIERLFGMESKTPRQPPLPAYLAVSIEGVFNMAGRVFVGLVSDIVGRKTMLLLLLLMQMIALIFIPITVHTNSFWGFLVLVWLSTVCYGGGFAMIPAFLADMYGINNTSSCHGIILTAWSIAAIAGGFAFTGIINSYISHGANMYDTEMYTVNFIWILVVVIFGFICCLFVRSSIRDRLFPAHPDQVLRMRIFGRIFRVLWMHEASFQMADPDCNISANHTANSTSSLRCKLPKRRLRFELLKKEQEQAAWEEYLVLRAVQHRLMNEPTIC